jgi:hypothetical protein
MVTTVGEIDYSLQHEKPIELTMGSPQYDHKMLQCSIDKVMWERSNIKCLVIIKSLTKDPIKGTIPECETTKEYLEKITSYFNRSSKAYACSLMMKFVNAKYVENGVRPFIQKMISIVTKLNEYLRQPMHE